MAVVDYFLKIDGIDGESTDHKHGKEIDVESWSWGEVQSGTSAHGSGGGAGKVTMQDFHFVMKVNNASPKLMLACASGEHIKKAVLTCRKAGKDQQEYLLVTISDLLVSSYQTGGSAHSRRRSHRPDLVELLQDRVSYKPQKPDGTLGGAVKAGYDLKVNKKV